MFEIAGLGLGLLGSIGKIFSRGKANKKLNALMAQDPTYVANPEAGQRLALAKQLLNARSPGAVAAERNIYSNQANSTAFATRAASDASQLLASVGDIQGNTNAAFNRLGASEAADYQRRYGNLENAQEAFIREGDKVYNDQVRRFGNKVQLTGAQVANNANNWGDVSNLGFGLMDFGAAGGFDNLRDLFGGGSGGGRNGGIGIVNQNKYGGWSPRRFE